MGERREQADRTGQDRTGQDRTTQTVEFSVAAMHEEWQEVVQRDEETCMRRPACPQPCLPADSQTSAPLSQHHSALGPASQHKGHSTSCQLSS